MFSCRWRCWRMVTQTPPCTGACTNAAAWKTRRRTALRAFYVFACRRKPNSIDRLSVSLLNTRAAHARAAGDNTQNVTCRGGLGDVLLCHIMTALVNARRTSDSGCAGPRLQPWAFGIGHHVAVKTVAARQTARARGHRGSRRSFLPFRHCFPALLARR